MLKTNQLFMTSYSSRQKIILDRIEEVKIDLGYTNDKVFAKDCGVSYPTLLAIRETHTAGVKFLNGINALLVKNKKKAKGNKYFIQDV